jgi:CheY-like chemotaxis protein
MVGQKILVIESNPTRRKTLNFVLSELGDYEVIHTDKVMEALELVKA